MSTGISGFDTVPVPTCPERRPGRCWPPAAASQYLRGPLQQPWNKQNEQDGYRYLIF